MARNTKIVNVSYGIFNHPNTRGIEKAIDKWTGKGFKLASRQEHPTGCFTSVFTLFLARGKTELTFIRDAS